MDIDRLIVEYGGVGLLAVSFVAATIVPLSSEAAVAAAVALGLPSIETLAWASAGNCLGVTLNYWLGRLGRKTIDADAISKGVTLRALRWLERFGKWGLLASWLPIVGDPLTLVAGISRVNFLFFVIVAFAVRILRYAALIAALA
jgi:membrane protein YqaA with SNARE-associated domain